MDQHAQPPLRFVYLTRHLNRSGYAALVACLEAGFRPQAVVVAESAPTLCRRWSRPFALGLYRAKCWFYRCPPLKATDSEELYARAQGLRVVRVPTGGSPEFQTLIADMDLDLLVVGGGWHEKLPTAVLSLPRFGSINLHPSRLPEFRGTSITRWQILNQVAVSGATVHYMDAEFDTGPVIAQQDVPTTPEDTPQELFSRLAGVGALLLTGVLAQFAAGQRPSRATIVPDPRFDKYYNRWKWDAKKLVIDPRDSLRDIHFRVKACTQESYEYPGPVLALNGRDFIVRETELRTNEGPDSKTVHAHDSVTVFDGMIIWERATEPDTLVLTKVQPLDRIYLLTRASSPGAWCTEGDAVSMTRTERDVDEFYAHR